MKALLVLAACALALSDARPAHAIAACNNNFGLAPLTGATLPPNAKLSAFSDLQSWGNFQYTATIDGAPVKLKLARKKIAPYYITDIEVDSPKTGTLKIFQGTDTKDRPLATYTVKAGVVFGKELAATTKRYTETIQHSTVQELFDALSIELGDAPAVSAHVKIRRDDKAAWSEFDLPVHGKTKAARVLLGALGCTSNYTVGLLENGVDLEVTAMLPDGKTVPVKLPKHVVLPKAPKQP